MENYGSSARGLNRGENRGQQRSRHSPGTLGSSSSWFFIILETYSFLTEHARTQTHISKKRLTPVGKYSHAASEVALLRTPLKTRALPHPTCKHPCEHLSLQTGRRQRSRAASQAGRREAAGGDWLHVRRGFGSDEHRTGERSSNGNPGLNCPPGVSPTIASQKNLKGKDCGSGRRGGPRR